MEALERRSCPAALVGGTFGWALEIGLIGSSDSHRIAADADGNVYVAGGFFGTHDFDPGPATVVLSSRSDDVFLAKLNSQGQLQWLRQFGGGGDDRVDAISIDTDGNITLAGTFHGSADFDPGAGVAILAGESGYSSVYVVQISSGGDFRWATQFDGPGDDEATALVADENGHLLVAGVFASNCDFDPGPEGSVLDVNAGNGGNNFVVSLTATGGFRWVRQYKAFVRSVAFDSTGSALIGGTFYGQMEVDPTNPANKLLSANYGSAAFVLKLGPGGAFSWARHIGGLSDSYGGRASGLSVAVDSEDNILLGGYFAASVGFDSGVSGSVLNSRGQTDAFLVKWSLDGGLRWLREFGASGYDRVSQVSVLADGTVAVVGEFEFTVDFDSGPAIQQLTSAGRENAYVLGLTKEGDFGWVRQFGGANATIFTGSTATRAGQDLLLAGSFVNTISVLPEDTLTLLRPREAGTSINGATSGGDRANASGYWGGFAMLLKVPTALTPASAPLGLSAIPMDTSVQLAWSTPEFDGGGEISDFLVQYSSDSGLTWVTVDDGTSTLTSAEVVGLTNGRSYVFRVAAVTSVGAGAYTAPSAPVVLPYSPNNITLSGTAIAENRPAGTAVGTFSTDDLDSGNTFTYALVAGAGSADNSAFTIVGNQLRTTAAFDYETKDSYSIRIRSTDAGGLSIEREFTVSVTDMKSAVGDAHVISALSTVMFAGVPVRVYAPTEPGLPAGLAGELNVVATHPEPLDLDGVNAITFSATGLWGNQWGGESGPSGKADYRTTASAYEHFGIAGIRNAPLNLLVGVFTDNTPASERAIAAARIDYGVGFDGLPSLNQTFPIGTGGTPIQVPAGATRLYLGFHDGYTWSDNVGAVTVTVELATRSPEALALSATSVAEGLSSDTFVGDFSTTDPDEGDTFTYTLVAGTGDDDNASFLINGHQLRTAASFDFETKSAYAIRVRSTDQAGLFTENSFIVNVLNVNDAPTLDSAASPVLVPVATEVVLPVNGNMLGSTRVSALIDASGPLGNFTDPDGDPPGMALVGLNLHGGRLWFSLDNATSWQEITQASPTSATLLHADEHTRLFFAPAAGFQGTVSDVITFRAWDRGGGHANGATGVNTLALFAPAGATLATGPASEFVTVSRDGRHAFIVDHSGGLIIVDVGNPTNPVRVGAFKGTGEYRSVAVSGDGRYAYFATGSTGLQVIDVSTPSSPIRVGGFNTAGFASYVTLSADGRYAYVADGGAGLRILDISNPQAPRNVGGIATSDWARGVAVSADGDYAFVSDWTAGLKIIDIRNPTQPVQVAAFGTAGYADGVAMLPGDRHVLVAANTGGLQVVDVNDPAAPVAVGRSDTLYTARRVAVTDDGRYAYVADGRGGVTLVDVRSPWNPLPLAHASTISSAETVAVSADGRHLFVAIGSAGLQVIAVSSDPSPFSLATAVIGVDVGPSNAAPFGISLSATTVPENLPATARVGILTASDADYGDTFTFSLVSGVGSGDNSFFEIVGNELQTGTSFDFEFRRSYSIRVRASDQGGLSIEKEFSVVVTDANDVPVLSPAVALSLVPVAAVVTAPVSGSTSASTLVSSLVDAAGQLENFTDADGDLPGIAIVGMNLQGGRLWFSTNDAASWTEITRASLTSATLLHADSLTRLFFSPAHGFRGKLTDVITFRAWDRGGGYANGATGVNVQPLLGPAEGVLASGAWADLVVTSRDSRYAFMVDGSSQLTVVDISNPLYPQEVGAYRGLGEFQSVALSADGQHAFLANGNAGVLILDVHDRANPTLVAKVKTPGFATHVTLSPDDRFAFVADGYAGLRIIDVTTRSAPRMLGGAGIDDWARNVVMSADASYAYVADWTQGLKIFDVRDPERPSRVASFATAGYVDGLVLGADGRYLFAAVTSAGLQVIDVNNPAAPVSVGRSATFDVAERLTLSVDGRYALVADQHAGVTAIDVQIPNAPLRIGSFNTPGVASGIAVSPDGRHIVIADGVGSLRVLPISMPLTIYSEASAVVGVSIGLPTNVTLSRSWVAENLGVGATVGTLSTEDPDVEDIFTYTLVSGEGSTDNASFTIVDDELRTATAFHYETKASYSIRVRSTDAGGLFTEKVFAISVTDIVEDWSLEQGLGEVVFDLISRSGASRLVKTGLGTLILDQANTHSGGTLVEAGELVIRNPAALGTGTLQVAPGAKVTLDVGTRQVPVSRLELSSTGMLDLATGSVLLAPGNYDLAAIRGFITGARGSGTWTGPGITSSSIQPGSFREVGYHVRANGSLLVGYAAVGDANLDGFVNVQDLIALNAAGKYGSTGANTNWWEGDFNYDGFGNINDLIALLSSGLYGKPSYLPAAPGALGVSAASEAPLLAVPSSLTPNSYAAPESQPKTVQAVTSTTRAAEPRRIDEFTWAAIANQSETEKPADGKVTRWRMVGR